MKTKSNSTTVCTILELIKKYGSEEHLRFLRHSLQLQECGYGASNVCVGTKVPVLRDIAEHYGYLNSEYLERMLRHEVHEMRFVALLIMIDRFSHSKKSIYDLYVRNIGMLDNWDLVDLSAHKNLGEYSYLNSNCEEIINLSNDDGLWKNRVAVVSTWAFIKRGKFEFPLQIIKKVITHPHHLILKASGWMLREIGKRDQNAMMEFILENNSMISSITKSYAMEIFRKRKN